MGLLSGAWNSLRNSLGTTGDYVGTGLDYMSSDNPMYDAYYKANPYVGQTYRKTIWDSLFGGLFRTGYDKWLEEMQLNSAQYDAGITDIQQQNEYNSEAANSQRMRAAGLNPDLLGTGDVSDSASTNPDPQDAQIPEALDFSQVSGFAGMIAQCFQGALGMASSGIDLISKVSQIDNQQIDNAGKMQDLALQYIRNSIPAVGMENDADYNSWKEKLLALSSPDVSWDESLARSLGLKKNQRKSFDLALNNGVGSLPSEYERFKMMDDLADEKLSSARKYGSSFYAESFEVMKGISAELVQSNDQLQSLKARVDVLEQDRREQKLNNEMTEGFIQEQYLDTSYKLGVGRSKAITENEEYNLTKLQQSVDRTLKQTRKKILDMLQGMADSGNSFANYMIYNMMLHEYMNFEFKAKGDFGIGKVLPKSVAGWLPSFGADVEIGASM